MGFQPQERQINPAPPCKGGRIACSIPNVPLVESHAVPLEKYSALILESHFTVMYFLIHDVSNDSALVRFANRESAVAGLPTEAGMTFLPHHFGRAGFELLDQFSQRDRARKTKQQIHVIGDATHLNRLAVLASQTRG